MACWDIRGKALNVPLHVLLGGKRRSKLRTYASQLLLMDRFPGYVFGGSQPQLYAFVKENYPPSTPASRSA